MTVTLGELAVRFGCELRGDPQTQIDSVGALAQAGPRAISFLANAKFARELATTRAAAVILDAKAAATSTVAALVAPNPHATFARIASLLHPAPPLSPGVHATASVSPSAQIDVTAEVGPHVFIGHGARIGARCFIGPGCVIESDAVIGDDTRLIARAHLAHRVRLGRRCIVHPGAVIGSDGFGFANEKSAWIKVPQIGTVVIGDDVEIGANTTIDRGAIGDTVIEDGVKLDNLVMIAHNCRIGAHSAFAAQVGIAGSTIIGRRCIFGGHSGTVGHIELCDDVVVTGKTMITHSIRKPGMYSSGLPGEEASAWRRIVARLKRIDTMAKRLRTVETHLDLKPDRESSED